MADAGWAWAVAETTRYATLQGALACPIEDIRLTLAQYVGRLHRLHPEKREVRVYDYVDE